MSDSPTFESAYARLEQILEKMNSGKVSLEESLKLYEEADHLIVWCSKQLVAAEQKIAMLIKNRDSELMLDATGAPQMQEFAPSGSAMLQRSSL